MVEQMTSGPNMGQSFLYKLKSKSSISIRERCYQKVANSYWISLDTDKSIREYMLFIEYIFVL